MSARGDLPRFDPQPINSTSYLVKLGDQWLIYRPNGDATCNDCVKHPDYCNEGWKGCEKYYPKEEVQWLMRSLKLS